MKLYSVFRLGVRVPSECFDGSVQGAPLISAWTHQTTFEATVKIFATGAIISGSDNYTNQSGKCEIHAKPFGKMTQGPPQGRETTKPSLFKPGRQHWQSMP